MAVDTACWIILACAVAFMAIGCISTRRRPTPAQRDQATENVFDQAA